MLSGRRVEGVGFASPKFITLAGGLAIGLLILFLKANVQANLVLASGLGEAGDEIAPQWEAGQSRLAFLKINRLCIYDAETGQPPKPVTLSLPEAISLDDLQPLSFAWSPAGGHRFVVLYAEKKGRLALYLGQDYQIIQRLIEFPQGGKGVQFSRLSWSPDGQEILYADNGVLYRLSLSIPAKIQPERLIPDGVLPDGPQAESWGVLNPQDKDVLAFQSESNGRQAIYVYHRTLKKIIGRIEGHSSICHPAWSPDGGKLVFFVGASVEGKLLADSRKDTGLSWGLGYVSYDQSRKEISPLREVSRGDMVRRKPPYADFTPICWTPDSRRIIYAAYGQENEPKLTIANLSSGKTSKLNLGERIAVNTPQGHATFWNMRLIYSDISCACTSNGKCRLAFAAEVDLGESNSRVVIRDIDLADY